MLFLSTALTLEGLECLYGAPEGGGDTHEALERLYVQAAGSGDDRVANQAKVMLFSKYMERKEYERAEKLLEELPEETVNSKNRLQINLYMAQGRWEDAAPLAQKDAEEGMKILKEMLPAMLEKWEPHNSVLYSRIPRKENDRNMGSLLMPGVLGDLENPEVQDFDFLREVPGFTEFMKEMKEKLQK